MSSGIGCTVYTLDSTGNRIRLADGSPGDPLSEPTVLTGLKVTWGRDTTVDQPSAATCSFKMVDFGGAGTFAELVKVGTPVEVWAQPAGVEVINRNRVINPGHYQGGGGWEPGAANSYRGPNVVESWPTASSSLDRCYTVYFFGSSGQTGTASVQTTDDALFDVAPGETLAIQVHVKPRSTPRRARLALRTYDSTGAIVIRTQYLPLVTEGADWTQLAGIITAPDTARKGRLLVQFLSVAASGGASDPNGEYHYVDAGMVSPPTAEGTIPDYFDGDTIDPTGTYAYTWAGTPHQSASIQSTGGDPTQIVPVFAGRCTSIKQKWDDTPDAPTADIEAIDFTADLENVIVGDQPWPAQRWTDRFRIIAGLAGLTQYELDSFGNINVSYRDIDAQGAMGLLAEIASSLDGILWPTVASGAPALWLEDPTRRPSLKMLTYDERAGYVEIVPTTGTSEDMLTVSACDILRDPVEWVQDVQDVTSRVSVTWKEQTTDDDGKPAPTDRTRTVIHSAREQAFGNRAISLSSQLVTDADATSVAERILARTAGTNWRINGVALYDDDPAVDPDEFAGILITLLSTSTRHGATIQLTDLPQWAPSDSSGVYVEGGDYTFTDGVWALDLIVSNPAGLGESLSWADLREHSTADDWTWEMFDPAITWLALYGVAPPSS